MSIIAEQSVGDVIYAQISEAYPVFSATNKYVAINSEGRMFTNVPNSTMWFPLDKDGYSEMQTWDNANATTVATANVNAWFVWANTSFNPTATTLSGFIMVPSGISSSIEMSATSENTGRFLSTAMNSFSIVAIASSDQTNYEIMPILNNSLSLPTIEGNVYWGMGSDGIPDIANGRCTMIADRIMDIDGNAGDFIKTAFRHYNAGSSTTAAGTIYNRNYKLGVKLLEEATVLLYENWEYGQNGWTTINDTTNKFNIGTGTSFNGLYSLYVSTGTSVNSPNVYNTGSTSVSHIYKDVVFPVGNQSDSLTPKYASFQWKCSGKTNVDYGALYITPPTYTPTAGTIIDSSYRVDVLTGNSNFISDKTFFSTLPKTFIPGTGATSFTGITETWESGTFGTWNVVNGASNIWSVGTQQASGGTYGAYITNAGTYGYLNTAADVSHFYTDFTIPADATIAQLSFTWKCSGENASVATQYDYGTVCIIDTTSTPVAATEIITTQAAARGNGRIGAVANLGKFNTGYSAYTGSRSWFNEVIDLTSYSGLTKRLVFSWANDTSLGATPMVVDNILLTYQSSSGSYVPLEAQATSRVIFSWVNAGGGGTNPPLAVDNLKIYCYPAVPNDYTP